MVLECHNFPVWAGLKISFQRQEGWIKLQRDSEDPCCIWSQLVSALIAGDLLHWIASIKYMLYLFFVKYTNARSRLVLLRYKVVDSAQFKLTKMVLGKWLYQNTIRTGILLEIRRICISRCWKVLSNDGAMNSRHKTWKKDQY